MRKKLRETNDLTIFFLRKYFQHTINKSKFCPKIQFWQNPKFSRVFHPKKIDNFSENQSWIFGQKMKISNSVFKYLEQLVNARSLFRIFNQTEFDKITKFFGPFWGSVQERRVGFLDLEEDPHRRHFVIRRLHLSKFDEGDAQGPDVHFVVIRLITERLAKDHLSNTNCHNDFLEFSTKFSYLWSHPVGCPNEGIPLAIFVLVFGANAKVSQFDTSLEDDEN